MNRIKTKIDLTGEWRLSDAGGLFILSDRAYRDSTFIFSFIFAVLLSISTAVIALLARMPLLLSTWRSNWLGLHHSAWRSVALHSFAFPTSSSNCSLNDSVNGRTSLLPCTIVVTVFDLNNVSKFILTSNFIAIN